MTDVAGSVGLPILPEVHDRYRDPRAAVGARLLDVRLRPAGPGPPRVRERASRIASPTSGRSPDRQVTTLDCHDGIPVRPDLDGILTPAEMRDLADRIRDRGGNVNRILSDAHADGGRRSPAELHVLLGAGRRRRAVPRGPGDPAVREGRAPGLLRRAARGRERRRRGRADRRGPGVNRHDYSLDARSTPRWRGPWSGACSSLSVCATRTRLSRAIFWSMLTTTTQSTPVAGQRGRPDAGRGLRGWDRDRHRSRPRSSLSQWVTSLGPTAV